MKRFSCVFLGVIFWLMPALAQTNYARMLSGVNAQTGVTYTVVPADATRLITFQNAGAVAVTLPNGATQGFGAGVEFAFQNLGPGTATITCSSCTIFSNNAAGAGTYGLGAGQGVELYAAGVNYFTLTSGSGLPTAGATTNPALLGDCLRYNVNGDTAWDAVNCSMEVNGIYVSAQGGPVGFGSICTGNIGLATGTGNTGVFPTATRRAGITYFITPSPSTSTVVGMDCGQNGNNSIFPILAWYRYSTLFAISSTTNTRYWLGMATWNNTSGLGTNSTNILNTAKFATDTPNSNTIGFRYSSGTDTTFKAVSCVAAGSCTITDTGVTADTNPHLFELATNSAGTSIQYFIDHALVATITTNIPPALATQDGLMDIFWTGDNKNNNLSPSATFYMAQLALK